MASVCLSGQVLAQVWREVTPDSGPAPVPRRNAAAVLDPAGRQVIVLGGRGSSGDLNDLWSFDLATHTWTKIEPQEGPLPTPRFTHNAVFDQRDRRVLMWSGRKVDGGSRFFNDVWAFDLETQPWEELEPARPRPEDRYGTASVFDPRSRTLVTFAGFTSQGRFDDTWRFAADEDLYRLEAAGHTVTRKLVLLP